MAAGQHITLVSYCPILIAGVRPSSYDRFSLRAACAREIDPLIRMLRPVWLALLISPVLSILGCGGDHAGNSGSSGTSTPQPDFSISIPASVTVAPNSQQSISI